jgi:hypothetical protein
MQMAVELPKKGRRPNIGFRYWDAVPFSAKYGKAAQGQVFCLIPERLCEWVQMGGVQPMAEFFSPCRA